MVTDITNPDNLTNGILISKYTRALKDRGEFDNCSVTILWSNFLFGGVFTRDGSVFVKVVGSLPQRELIASSMKMGFYGPNDKPRGWDVTSFCKQFWKLTREYQEIVRERVKVKEYPKFIMHIKFVNNAKSLLVINIFYYTLLDRIKKNNHISPNSQPAFGCQPALKNNT